MTKRRVLAIAGFIMLVAPGVRAQSTAPLAFEVVSVKPHPTGDRRFSFPALQPGGRFVSNAPLVVLIATAYNISFQGPRLTGVPAWVRSPEGVYDIEATSPKEAFPDGLASSVRAERYRSMLQSLLADRFKLKIHKETKEMPVYALLVGKDGPKLERATVEEKDCSDSGGSDGKVVCHQFNGGQGRGLHSPAVSMADIVSFVENWTDRPFLDKTGIQGLFHIETSGWRSMQVGPVPPPGAKGEDGTDLADVPTVFQVFEKLGLRMEPRKDSADIFVIDHIEKPDAN